LLTGHKTSACRCQCHGSGEVRALVRVRPTVSGAGYVKRTMHDMIEICRRLAEVKDRLPHGAWLPWLRDEFGWSERTAHRFIDLQDRFGKSGTMPDLPALEIDASALHLLAKAAVPEEVREKAAKRAKAGERITLAEPRRMRQRRPWAPQSALWRFGLRDTRNGPSCPASLARRAPDRMRRQSIIRQGLRYPPFAGADRVIFFNPTLCPIPHPKFAALHA
jgi:hypothetical protein